MKSNDNGSLSLFIEFIMALTAASDGIALNLASPNILLIRFLSAKSNSNMSSPFKDDQYCCYILIDKLVRNIPKNSKIFC